MAELPKPADQDARNCYACSAKYSRLNLVVNLALAGVKGFIGVVAASRALLASALYSVNDVLSAVIVMVSLRVARRPPDEDHTYGHGKAEFVAVGIVSTVLAAAVVFILVFSVADIVQGVEAPPHVIALLVAVVTMGTNLYLARQGQCAARHLGSPVLRTCAEHNRADAISSVATMVGVGGALLGLHLLDPVVAIFETLHIVGLSGTLLGQALRGLMDSALPETEVQQIRRVCQDLPGVDCIHSLRTRQAGPQSWVDIDVAVAETLSVSEAHRITSEVDRAVRAALGRGVETQVKFRSNNGRPVHASDAAPLDGAGVKSHA
jgi:cation diffusion facilitator family transporter